MPGLLDQLVLPPPDPRSSPNDPYGQPRQINRADMMNYVMSNPELRQRWLNGTLGPFVQSPEVQARGVANSLGEAAVGATPSFNTIQRGLGIEIDPRVKMNEAHFDANRQNAQFSYGNGPQFGPPDNRSLIERLLFGARFKG